MVRFAEHPQYKYAKPDWKRCRDCREGERAIKACRGTGSNNNWPGTAYLPFLPGQTEAEYKAYIERAVFYNGFGRSIDALQGMIFSKPMVYSEEVRNAFADHLTDITKTGLSLADFAVEIVENQLTVGRCGILIDFDHMDGPVMRDQADALNLRPFWVLYDAEAIINWETAWINNATRISRIILRDSQESMLELQLMDGIYQQQKYRPDESDKHEWIPDGDPVVPTIGGNPLNEIPFKFIGVKNCQPRVDKPPLLDLANLNISHYRNSADKENGLHLAGTPTPYFFGIDAKDENGNIQLGANTAINSMNPQSSCGFLEFSGAGIAAIEAAMDKKESQMAALGSRVLTPEKKGVEAAETARIHRAAEYASLLSIALTTNAAIDWGLKWHSRFMQLNIDETEIYARVNKDFYPETFNPSEFQVLFQALQSGSITYDAFFRRLQRWGIYDEDEKMEDVQAQIEIEQASKPMSGGFSAGMFG